MKRIQFQIINKIQCYKLKQGKYINMAALNEANSRNKISNKEMAEIKTTLPHLTQLALAADGEERTAPSQQTKDVPSKPTIQSQILIVPTDASKIQSLAAAIDLGKYDVGSLKTQVCGQNRLTTIMVGSWIYKLHVVKDT